MFGLSSSGVSRSTNDSVDRDQHEHGESGQQYIVQIADDGGQADKAEEHDQNGRKATQSRNHRADDPHLKKFVVHYGRPLRILGYVCASA